MPWKQTQLERSSFCAKTFYIPTGLQRNCTRRAEQYRWFHAERILIPAVF